MSINWVMLPSTPSPSAPFTPLQNEQILYTSPARTSFSLSSLSKFPAHSPFGLSSSTGNLYLTSKRILYLPASPTPAFQSFAAPILNLQDSHVSAPWIGPNVWTALVRPVQGGNLPQEHAALEVKLTFRDGGAFDFSSMYERVRERVGQAVERAREQGRHVGNGSGEEVGRGRGPGVMEGVEVVMEDLPRYEDTRIQPRAVEALSEEQEATAVQVTAATESERRPSHPGQEVLSGIASPAAQVFTPPDEPPPGYEQVQRETIEDEFSRRLSAAAAEGRTESSR